MRRAKLLSQVGDELTDYNGLTTVRVTIIERDDKRLHGGWWTANVPDAQPVFDA